ncbi:MAG: BON domain-containing protein [Elusimicrobiota bacterium]
MKGTALGLALLFAFAGAGCTRALQPEDDSDPAVKARVESVLRGRKDIDIRFISLNVDNGIVTLSGIVPAAEQITVIQHLVARTRGVDQVMNNLVVQE